VTSVRRSHIRDDKRSRGHHVAKINRGTKKGEEGELPDVKVKNPTRMTEAQQSTNKGKAPTKERKNDAKKVK